VWMILRNFAMGQAGVLYYYFEDADARETVGLGSCIFV
jgi:hypothetical protein